VWSVRREWQAGIDGVLAFADTPGKAVNGVIAAHRRANAPVRVHPEHRQLVADTFEAFGRVNPADGPALLAFVAAHHSAIEFLTIEPDGRVLLVKGHVGPEEAFDIGQHVADFIHDRTPGAAEAEAVIKIVIEPTADTFKSWVVLPSGERLAGARCFTEPDARLMANRVLRALRSTVVSPSVVVSTAA
jgi:hypothetical protein